MDSIQAGLAMEAMSHFLPVLESDETKDETGTREAPTITGRGLTFVLLRAVAVGFEPTVKLPPHTLSRFARAFFGWFTMIHDCSRRFTTAVQTGSGRRQGRRRTDVNHGG